MGPLRLGRASMQQRLGEALLTRRPGYGLPDRALLPAGSLGECVGGKPYLADRSQTLAKVSCPHPQISSRFLSWERNRELQAPSGQLALTSHPVPGQKGNVPAPPGVALL